MEDITFRAHDKNDDVTLELSSSDPGDVCIVLTAIERQGTDDEKYIIVGLSRKQARKLALRLVEQAADLSR